MKEENKIIINYKYSIKIYDNSFAFRDTSYVCMEELELTIFILCKNNIAFTFEKSVFYSFIKIYDYEKRIQINYQLL